MTGNEIITTDQGVTFEPWTNGYAVGFKATAPDGRVQYVYINPSSGVDEPGVIADVFVYLGDAGDPGDDEPQVFIDLFASD